MQINQITIIGVGLIGGSFAKGIKALGGVAKVTGYDPNEDSLKKAVTLGVLDDYETTLAKAVADADLVMLAVPLGVMPVVLTEMRPFLKEKAILTDVGSAKVSVINAVEQSFGEAYPYFVAGHPIAGKEKSGVEAASKSLFQAHKVILTPTDSTDPKALTVVKDLWASLGACVTEMDPEYHDEVLAATSHLPHLLAFSLVDLLNDHEELGNVFQYTAGGFRDFTRIASSDATMWRDIALNNSDAIVKWLRNYQVEIDRIIGLIEGNQADALYDLFHRAKTARDTHIVKQ
ncbi:MAG: prephenate dehydrogenase/arogenate dehydrogenase family protein [Hydrogenovibrio sp.]|nr:prephenate dehydrogenase/arogenate dehydrogenase family protein [Hydrogenovibrio sp.]